MAHATISIVVITAILQVIKEYIVEKFQQKIFIDNAIEVARSALGLRGEKTDKEENTRRYMNYFFDIVSVQKIFPILLLDGSGLVIKLIVSLLLFLAFDPVLFAMGIFFVVVLIVLLIFSGHNGVRYAIERSDAKHDTIYALQHIPQEEERFDHTILMRIDRLLLRYVKTRNRMFGVIIRQLSLIYLLEGVVFVSFLIVGGYMVIEGHMPLGEFIATEVAVVYLINALKSFMKHIDYIYDIVEGLYKVEKLSEYLQEKRNA